MNPQTHDKMVLAQRLYKVVEGESVVYLQTMPELPDFTSHATGSIAIMSRRGRVDIPFDRHTVAELTSLLEVSVFDKVVVSWNFKNFVSYVAHYAKKVRKYDFLLFDLKIMEGFVGNRIKAPADFAEAHARLSALGQDLRWKKVYETVNLPLIKRVVPALENEGIIDTIQRKVVYAHYEIDRTSSGRMVCQLPANGYNPHTIGSSPNYKPRGEGDIFAYFDYKANEVRTIQWLSNDQGLANILASGKDLYKESWKTITGQEESPAEWKLSFLAVFFGMGAEAMSQRHRWSVDISREVISRMGRAFPAATNYLRNVRDRAKTEIVEDFFGRPRECKEEPYKAQNHVVQSAASVACLEKLILLHDRMPSGAKLLFNVHDGYAVTCEMRALPDVCREVLQILESPSELCPGLALKASAKVGKQLDKMIPIPEEWRCTN